MAVPAGIPVEQSISEIDAEIRMEDIRQSSAARLKMDHFHAAIKRNLMDKKLNYEAEHRKEILEGLKHMKRRLPAESCTSLVKKLENLAVNLECSSQIRNNEMFAMENDDLALLVQHKHDQAISARISYFGNEFPNDNEITRMINDNEWDELRLMIRSMLKTIPSIASKEMKHKLSCYRQSLERNMFSMWTGGATATISEVNESSVGWPAPGTSLRPMRIFIYGKPEIEHEWKEKGINVIDAEKGPIPYAVIVFVESSVNRDFSYNGTSFSFHGQVKLDFSSRWILSACTLEELKEFGARPSSVLQKTNLIRLVANCQMKEGDIEMLGKELGRDVSYIVKGEGTERDVIIDSLVLEDGTRLEEILLVLHKQAVFNASWESIVSACCIQSISSSNSTKFEMNTHGCNWEITFSGNGNMYNVRLTPSKSRHWTLTLLSNVHGKMTDLADEIEGAFNRTWSLSKCLSHLINRLEISGYEWKTDSSMNISFPRSDCSLQYESKMGPAWLRKDTPPLPPSIKHEYHVVLPKGRCSLLRMMREVKPRPPLKVARPRPQLSNPTVPPLRVNRLEAGLPPLQQHHNQFNQIENMSKGVDDRAGSSPMEGGSGMYAHPGYPNPSMSGGHRMGVHPGPSPLARGAMVGMGGGMNTPLHPYNMGPQQQEMMRQQLMRQQSAASMAAFDFHDDSRGSSPSSVNDVSPGYGGQYQGYAPPQSPLVRGGATGTKTRRARGRKAGNVGDRTPGSSLDSPSPSGFPSPDQKRPKSGPGSRGGRGSRGKRGISMEQSMSPFQRSVSEMSNPMSSPMTAAAMTPLYSQQSFDEGTSDEECDPPPFSRSLSTVQPTLSSTVTAPSRLSSSSTTSFTIQSSPLATPPVSQPLASTPIISVVPSPLVPSSLIPPSSTPTLASVLSAPVSYPSPISSSIPPTHSSSHPPSIPPISSLSSHPSSSSSPHPSVPFPPSLVRRKSSLESIVGQLNATQRQKKKAVSGPTSDLFDTGLEDSSPQPSSSTPSTAPLLYAEPKIESINKEGGEEKIVLKLKTKKESKKKKENAEKEKEKEKRKEEKSSKSGEDKDRKRKADSSTKEKKDKEAKKSKIEPPLIETDSSSCVTKMGMLKGFKIPKTKGPGDVSIPSSSSSSSSLAPPLISPSLATKPSLSTPSTSFSQSKGGPSQGVAPSSFRPPPGGGPIKGAAGARQQLPPQRGGHPKGILKASGGPPGPQRGPPQYPPERKASHPPYLEPPRSRQPSGGSVYPPPPLAPQSIRRPPLLKGVPPNGPSSSSSNWMPLSSRGPSSSDGPPTLTPAMPSGPNLSSRLDRPPTLESNVPSRSIIEDSPASPDGLHIVDD